MLSFICSKNEFIIIDRSKDTELTLIPEGDCCSSNWFDYSNLTNDNCEEYLKQYSKKEFKNWECEMKYRPTELEDPYNEGCYEEYDVFVNFEDESFFKFTFCHSCNGYYSGWITTTET